MSEIQIYIEKVKQNLVVAEARVKHLEALLKAHCECFGHTMVDGGRDSHYKYEKCSVCGKTEKT